MGLGESWHKVMVYFGIAEEDDYEDEDEEETMAPHREPQRELERSYDERPNVRKLNRSGRGRSDYDDIFADEAPPPLRSSSSGPRVVSPLEPVRQQRVEINLVVPKSFNDAQQIADKFKVDIPVVVNMQNAEVDLAKRLVDFCSGLTYAMDGGMQRVADRIFLLTPRNVEVSAEEKARLLEKGFFNQF
jgi:cell division inhibitor SepF